MKIISLTNIYCVYMRETYFFFVYLLLLYTEIYGIDCMVYNVNNIQLEMIISRSDPIFLFVNLLCCCYLIESYFDTAIQL